MHYYLFHPSLRGGCDDSADLLGRFMGLGKSYHHAMVVGTEKIRILSSEDDTIPLLGMVDSLKVTVIEEKHASLIERVIQRFGFTFMPQSDSDKGTLSMIALLLHRGRYDVIDQVIDTPVIAAADLTA